MKLNIFGLQVPVYHKEIDDKNLRGYYDTQAKEIFIAKEMKGHDFWNTMVHELIHAALYRTGFGQTQMPHDLHEMICENISVAICENFDLKFKK